VSRSGKPKHKRADTESNKTKESRAKDFRRSGLVVAVVLIAIVALALVWNGLQSTYAPPNPTTSTTSAPPVKKAYPILHIKLVEGNSSWMRGENDLPFYKSSLKWNICNEGTAIANDTRVVGLLDGAVVRDYTWPTILPNACQYGDVDLNLQYDTTHRFNINASSDLWSDSTFLEVKADLPRFLIHPQTIPSDELLEYAKLFITPNDPIVREASDRVFRESSFPNFPSYNPPNKLADLCPTLRAGGSCPDWIVINAVKGWVLGHVRHIEGQTSGYAHLPRETLRSGTGDDLDIAVLVVSIARAAGLPPKEVFAVLGTNGTVGGAWISESTPGQLWPSSSNLIHPCECSVLGPLACCEMRAVYYFNDQLAVRVS
jgi:hypothetical protein